jgi:tetratricopeptide (TPR) repeat protein
MRIYNLLIPITVYMSAIVIFLPSMAISQQINNPNGGWHSGNDQKFTEKNLLEELQKFSDYSNRFTLKLRSGDLEGALSDLDTLINIYPQQYSILYATRGIVHYRLGNKTKAELDFNIATNLEAADKYIKRGDAKSDSGDKRGAILDYDQAININPKSFLGYISRGSTKHALNDYKGAIFDFDEAINIKPVYDIIYGLRGIAKYRLNDKEGAILDFSKAISINPKLSESYAYRGIAKYALNDYKGAIADIDKAISINPEQHAQTYGIRGFAKYEINDKKGAINDLKVSAKLFKIKGDTESYNNTVRLIQSMSN